MDTPTPEEIQALLTRATKNVCEPHFDANADHIRAGVYEGLLNQIFKHHPSVFQEVAAIFPKP